jgi:hypothetical protein
MCSTCGCRNAEEFQAPMTAADDICIACTVESPEYNSNICKKCQEAMGIKKLSQKQAARFMAESENCPNCGADNLGKEEMYYCYTCGNDDADEDECPECNSNNVGEEEMDYCYTCGKHGHWFDAENFSAEGDASKTTSSLNARFFVGVGSGKDLLGKGKFMKYNDAVAKAKQVAEKEGKARVVSTRGLALWTHDGKGLFQAGTSTEEAKKYYRAEDGSVDMDAYANDYMAAEDGFFEAESKFDKLSDEIAAQYRKKGKSAAEAKRIGQATAAKIGFKKYGKKGMVAKAQRGRKMSAEGVMGRSEIPFAGLALLVLGYFGATKLRKKVTYDCEDCGCKECEEKKAEGYPEVYDPVQDFLPKYRYPKDSVWSNDYNPADPYRALDYQTVHTDSNTKADRM